MSEQEIKTLSDVQVRRMISISVRVLTNHGIFHLFVGLSLLFSFFLFWFSLHISL